MAPCEIADLGADAEIIHRRPFHIGGKPRGAQRRRGAGKVDVERQPADEEIGFPLVGPGAMVGGDRAPAACVDLEGDHARQRRQVRAGAEIGRGIHRVGRLHAHVVVVADERHGDGRAGGHGPAGDAARAVDERGNDVPLLPPYFSSCTMAARSSVKRVGFVEPAPGEHRVVGVDRRKLGRRRFRGRARHSPATGPASNSRKSRARSAPPRPCATAPWR